MGWMTHRFVYVQAYYTDALAAKDNCVSFRHTTVTVDDLGILVHDDDPDDYLRDALEHRAYNAGFEKLGGPILNDYVIEVSDDGTILPEERK